MLFEPFSFLAVAVVSIFFDSPRSVLAPLFFAPLLLLLASPALVGVDSDVVDAYASSETGRRARGVLLFASAFRAFCSSSVFYSKKKTLGASLDVDDAAFEKKNSPFVATSLFWRAIPASSLPCLRRGSPSFVEQALSSLTRGGLERPFFSAHNERLDQIKLKKKTPKVAKLAETIANLSKNALTTNAPPTSSERSGLRKAAHQLSEMAKSGEREDSIVVALLEKRREEMFSKRRKNDHSLAQLARLLVLCRFLSSSSFNLLLPFSLFLYLPRNNTKKNTEEKVDAVVEGGAVRAVVPLLTMFKVDGRGVST